MYKWNQNLYLPQTSKNIYGFKFGLVRGLEVLKKITYYYKNMHMWKVVKNEFMAFYF